MAAVRHYDIDMQKWIVTVLWNNGVTDAFSSLEGADMKVMRGVYENHPDTKEVTVRRMGNVRI